MPEAVTSDDRSRRSLADDPEFLASLSKLDRDVPSDDPESQPQPNSKGSTRQTQAPRRLSELFPSTTPAEAAAFDTLAMSHPVTAGQRRLIPILDAVPDSRPMPPGRSISESGPKLESTPALEPDPETDNLEIPDLPLSAAGPARRRERRSGDRGHVAYETFYGLSEPPFSLNADPRFLYHSQSYDRVAQQVLDAIRQRDGIAILTGEAGVGKTTLCRVVMDQLDRRTLTSFAADAFVAPEALIRNVLVDFGVASTADVRTGRLSKASRDDLKIALRDFLYSLAPIGAFAVIIIDEAHRLSQDQLLEVRSLIETGGDEQLLQILLVGEPPLLRTLSRSSLRTSFGRVSVRAALGPLPQDEISGYLAHRLKVAGAGPRLEFQPSAVARLFELSGGNPRTINTIADRALARGRVQSSKTIGANILETAAEELDLVPEVPTSILRRIAAAAGFAILMLVGAAAGAFVFRSEVAALIRQWQAEPAFPLPPRPDLPAAYQPPPSPGGVQ
jgi:type II secretory pathway predicted ATPase ExeA